MSPLRARVAEILLGYAIQYPVRLQRLQDRLLLLAISIERGDPCPMHAAESSIHGYDPLVDAVIRASQDVYGAGQYARAAAEIERSEP